MVEDIPYKYRHYYIDNIHNIVNEGEYPDYLWKYPNGRCKQEVP